MCQEEPAVVEQHVYVVRQICDWARRIFATVNISIWRQRGIVAKGAIVELASSGRIGVAERVDDRTNKTACIETKIRLVGPRSPVRCADEGASFEGRAFRRTTIGDQARTAIVGEL